MKKEILFFMALNKFNQVEIICTSNDKSVKADVLNKNDKMLKVAISNTNATLTLYRNDMRTCYIGNVNGLEFTSDGETL